MRGTSPRPTPGVSMRSHRKGNMLSYIQANTRKHLFFEFTSSFWLVQNPCVFVFQFCSEVDTVSLSTVLLNVASVKGSAIDNHATTF